MMLAVENISKHYHFKKHWYLKTAHKQILRDISFTLSAANIAVLGNSGSGKSTLGRILCMLEAPSSGCVKFENKIISNLDFNAQRAFRKDVQYIFQSQKQALNPAKSASALINNVYKNFALTPEPEYLAELFELLEFSTKLLNYQPHELSGGQCQKLGLILALIIRPKLLILDEITSGIDAVVEIKIIDFLKQLNTKQIYITHKSDQARELANEVLILNDGAMQYFGNWDGAKRN